MEEVGMSTLSLNIRMHGKQAVIIGGGTVAARKVRTLQAVGASVRVVATNITSEIAELKDSGAISVRFGTYTGSDLDGAFLVIASTNDALVNRQIFDDANGRGLLVSVVDNPAVGNCTFPAILRRGDVEIAVSTDGRCPTFAAVVRDCIAEHIGHEYGVILEQLAEEREKLLTNESPGTYNAQVLRSLARSLLAAPVEPTDCKE